MQYNRLFIVASLVLAVCFCPATILTGQTTKYDYVQSSSPLSDGRVISRTDYADPSKPSQTTISGSARVATNGFANRPGGITPYPLSTNNPPRPQTAFQVPAANVVPSLSPQNLAPNPNCANCDNPGLPNSVNGQAYPYPAASPTPASTFPPNNYFSANNANINPSIAPNTGPQPVLRLRTLPATTYLGQGIIGQPTAYVPGEPFRNMLRYIMP